MGRDEVVPPPRVTAPPDDGVEELVLLPEDEVPLFGGAERVGCDCGADGIDGGGDGTSRETAPPPDEVVVVVVVPPPLVGGSVRGIACAKMSDGTLRPAMNADAAMKRLMRMGPSPELP